VDVNMSLLLAYALSVLMLVATPGPVVALIVSTSMNAGPRQAWLTALGTNAASLLLALLAVLMLSGGLALDPRLTPLDQCARLRLHCLAGVCKGWRKQAPGRRASHPTAHREAETAKAAQGE